MVRSNEIKINKYFLLGIVILIFNLIFVDLIYFVNIDKEDHFDPLVGNEDYLRHHSIAREVYEGKGFFSIYDDELNNLPYGYAQPIPTLGYSLMLFLTFGNTALSFFLSVIFLSIATYYFLNKIIRYFFSNKNLSYIISSIILITGNFVFSFWYMIPKGVVQVDSILILHRIMNPLFTFPLLFLCIYLILKRYKLRNRKETQKKLFFQIGLVFSLLLLSYFYFWTFALVLYALVELMIFIQKKEFKNTIINNVIFGITILPAFIIYVINSLLFNNISFYKEYLIRNNVIFTRNIVSSQYEIFYIFIAIVFIGLFFYLHKRNLIEKEKLIFLGVGVIASYICLYANVIVGMSIQKGHWFAFITHIFLLIIGLLTIFLTLKSFFKEKFRININLRTIAIVILVFMTIFNVLSLTYVGIKDYDKFQIDKDEKKVYQYLNEVTLENVYVLAEEKISRRIVGFTNKNTIFVDKIELVDNTELELRQTTFNHFLKTCEINYHKGNIIVVMENKTTCENLDLLEEIGKYSIYSINKE